MRRFFYQKKTMDFKRIVFVFFFISVSKNVIIFHTINLDFCQTPLSLYLNNNKSISYETIF